MAHVTQDQTTKPQCIIVDWGTTTLRASLVLRSEIVMSTTEVPRGIQVIAPNTFEDELVSVIGDWLNEYGTLPVVAFGMVTSRNGWIEVPYVSCPADASNLAKGTIQHSLPNGSSLIFLPGLTDPARTPFPDVMRGEETQIIGYGLDKDITLVLPGTHSKWSHVRDGKIAGFQTFVTGELFALLSQHSFIAKSAGVSIENPGWDAFEAGVGEEANDDIKADAIFSLLFSARTGMLG